MFDYLIKYICIKMNVYLCVQMHVCINGVYILMCVYVCLLGLGLFYSYACGRYLERPHGE